MGRPVDGYPTVFGDKRASVFPHVGPASYNQITYGPLANGDIVSVVEAGMKYFDFVTVGMTDSGNFSCEEIPINSSTGPVGTQSTTWRLKWIAQRTALIGGQNQTAGTEAVAGTNLSGETMRIFALGPK